MTRIHDLTHLSHEDVYDETQTNDDIKDGDFILVAGGVAVLQKAWPVMVEGTSKDLHSFDEDNQAERDGLADLFRALGGRSYDVSLVSANGNKFEIDTTASYGYWEFRDGSEGGGLWFTRTPDGKLELEDFDGHTHLPQSIVNKLRESGYVVDETFDN